ncbi:MAG: hypothetical protein ACI8RZ_002892 [Myxococcota bacterium]
MSQRLRFLSPRLWDIAALAVVVAVVVAQVSFLLADGRIPSDQGLYYRDLPQRYADWQALDLSAIMTSLGESTGWYNALIALAMVVFGVSPQLFATFGAVWVGLILVGVGLIARKLHSPAAGLAAVCLAAAMPAVFLMGRTAWIHTPETALILTLVAVWVWDRTLEHRRTVVALALLGMLTVALRPSGVIWVGMLTPLLMVHAPRRWLRIGAVALSWLVSLAVPLDNAEHYMLAKAQARERYADQLPDLMVQIIALVGHLPLGVVAVGLVAGIISLLVRRPKTWESLIVVLLLWPGGSLLLWSLFQAGLDNFPLIAPGLAILGGWGLARLGRPLALLGVPVFLLVYIPQWVPTASLMSLHRIPGAGLYLHGSDIKNHYRVYQRYGWADLQALIAATCGEAQCIVAVDQGLLEPFSEDIGALELFLTEADDTVKLVSIRNGTPHSSLDINALVEFHCDSEADLQWRQRFPQSIDNLTTILSDYKLQPVWSRPVRNGCEVIWMTPEGALLDADAMPTDGQRILPMNPRPAELDGSGPMR